MLDAKDQWPAIFLEPLPPWLRSIGKLALTPYFYLARRTLREATAFCAMSDEFVDWMCVVAGRERTVKDTAAPLTAPTESFRVEELIEARQWWAAQGVDCAVNRRVSFVGSFSSAFNFSIVRDLARECISMGANCQFVICGDGGAAEQVKRTMSGVPGVVMPGWIDAPKSAALFASSIATVAPYVNNDAFMRSIPNKILDSFAHNLPVITTLRGTVERLVGQEGVGIASQRLEVLLEFLRQLLNDKDTAAAVSERARQLFAKRFSFDAVYGKLVRSVETLAAQ
jgi:glycosyltransferase involved in cell wall biosynthesis